MNDTTIQTDNSELQETPQYPRHTYLADFNIDNVGHLTCSLNIDFRNFEVPFNSYFNGDDELSAEEYEAVYREITRVCGQSGEYTIRPDAEKYAVCRILTPTEDECRAEMRLRRDRLLEKTDRFMLPDYPVTEAEREQYKQYRQYLRDLPEAPEFPDIDILSFTDWLNNNSLA